MILLSCFCLPAHAFVAGPSNLPPIIGYPDPPCFEPVRLYTNDRIPWDIFKIEAEEYEFCVRKYVEAANNDQKRITEKRNKAIEKFNNFVKSMH